VAFGDDPDSATLQTEMQRGLGRSRFRTFGEIGELLAGLEMVEPGLVLVPDWHPDPDTPDVAHPVLKLLLRAWPGKPAHYRQVDLDTGSANSSPVKRG
jgi:hypothetical protein